jgi:hypothetical protein
MMNYLKSNNKITLREAKEKKEKQKKKNANVAD